MKKEYKKTLTASEARENIKRASIFFSNLAEDIKKRHAESEKEREQMRKEFKDGARRTTGCII